MCPTLPSKWPTDSLTAPAAPQTLRASSAACALYVPPRHLGTTHWLVRERRGGVRRCAPQSSPKTLTTVPWKVVVLHQPVALGVVLVNLHGSLVIVLLCHTVTQRDPNIPSINVPWQATCLPCDGKKGCSRLSDSLREGEQRVTFPWLLGQACPHPGPLSWKISTRKGHTL